MEKNKLRISKKMRAIIVIAFIAIYALGTYVSLRGQYLEYVELGEQYVEKFFTDIKYKYSIMGITFVLLSIILYFTNRGIKKGLKPFFEQEKREVPKLPNKSITLIVAAIASVIVSNDLVDKVLLFVSNASFGKTDIIFNLDISYYMFIKPLVEALLSDFVKLMIALSAYMAGYYIIIFNFYFKAVDRELLRKSKLIKKLLRNAIIVSIGMALQNALNTQNIVTGKFLTLSNGTELTGAGVIESTIQLWGYLILSVIIVIAVIISVKFFAQNKMKKIVYPVAVVPIYLVTLFLVMVGYDFIFVKSNEFDKERKYISENIKSTQEAYNIKVKETSIEYSGTIKEDEVEKNDDVIDNITIVNKDLVKKSLKDTQTETGYYTYNSVSLAKYNINGKDQLTYVAPREAENNTISYNNKTYEYTHGMGQIIASATSVTEDGNVEYLQKDISGSDNMLEVKEPRIYYGVETNSVAVTNTKNKSEYDYTDSDGVEHVNNYDGNSGIQVGFWDRLILAVKNKDIRLAMTSSISSESKILTNRNIVKRAKAVLPNLIYDENPYTVVDDGKIYWVLDAYTVSDKYPYSTYTEVEYDGAKRNINYIRNSVKVIINAYDGEMTFYITDRNDPVIMAYLKLYPTIFSDYTGKEIPDGIKQQMKYPKFLYDVQSEMLMVYHNVKEDVLYRNNDIWALTKYGTTSTKSKVATLEPYYAMIKTPDNDKSELGLIQMYTQNGKSNITSYLVGSCNGTECELKIYKYPTDSNILGPIQLDNQIDQDETISTELSTIDVTGSKISKDMKIIPINNTVLYVETIYQTMTNEPNQPTTLKKVIVASGTKVAIGNTLEEAISNLLSQSAVNIEITNTEDVDGMIQAIINANKNLTESNDRNDWEMMGSDLKELQSLIDSLDKMIKENNKKTQ
ncbi:MAG: hypothetical protein BHW02_04540 [Clostridium sp. 28_12]|nr:MAG: hypothetical protein BHW02_04540 [Clostridium sp. 28_12]